MNTTNLNLPETPPISDEEIKQTLMTLYSSIAACIELTERMKDTVIALKEKVLTATEDT